MKLKLLPLALLVVLSAGSLTSAQAQHYVVKLTKPTLKIDGSSATPPSSPEAGTPTSPSALTADLSTRTLAFGDVLFGANQQQSVGLFNTGTTPLTFSSSPYLTNDSSQAYTASTTCAGSLAPQATCSVTVALTSDNIGSILGTLVFPTNATNGPHTVALSARGLGSHFEALLDGVPATQLPAFTGVGIGSHSSPASFQLKNTGNLTGTPALTVSPSEFTVQGCSGSLAPGAACTANVTFTPTDATEVAGVIRVAGSADAAPLNVDVRGTGAAVDASTWVVVPGTASGHKYNVTFGAGKFMTLQMGVGPLTSQDGVTWKTTPWDASLAQAGLREVSYVNGKYLAVGSATVNGNSSGYSAISADGVTWAKGTLPHFTWYAPAYGNGRYVTVEASTMSQIASSTNGVSWSVQQVPGRWAVVAFGAGKFITAPFTVSSTLAVSTNGTTWSTIPNPLPGANNGGIAYVNGRFVLVQGAKVALSVDGANWTVSNSPVDFNNGYAQIAYGGGTYSITGSGTRHITSTDGINWKAGALPNNSWNSQAYGNGRFVVSGYNSAPLAHTN